MKTYACVKVAYPSRMQAGKATREVWRRKPFEREGVLAPYRCSVCSSWHIGHEDRLAHAVRRFHPNRRRGDWMRDWEVSMGVTA